MLIPLIVLGTSAFYGHKAYKVHKAFTPERKALYSKLMNSPSDPTALRSAADSFQAAGLTKQADMLRKRAALREAPESLKAARREVFKKAMGSNDPSAIEAVAKAHEDVGAEGAAQALRVQAETLRAVKAAE